MGHSTKKGWHVLPMPTGSLGLLRASIWLAPTKRSQDPPPPALQEPSAQVWGVFYNQVTYPGTSGGWQSQCDGRKGDCTLQGKLGQGALLHHQALGQGCLHQTRSISLLLWELQSSAWDKQLRTGSRSGVAKSKLSARTPRARGTRDPYRDSTCTRKALGRAAEEGSTSPHWAEGPTMQEQLG